MPRAIVSCLYRVDPAQLEGEPPEPLPIALAELAQQAAALIDSHRVGNGRTFDLSGLHHELLELLLDGRLTPSGAALVLHRVLAPIPIRDRASLALYLANSIRAERLSQLAHGTLLTLRRAILLEDADVSQPALGRLEGALAQRAAALFWSGPVLVAGDRVAPSSVEAAIADLGSGSARQIVVLVPEDERTTSREVLLEHLRLQVRCVEDSQGQSVSPFLTQGAVRLVPARLGTARLSWAGWLGRLVKAAWAAPLRLGFEVSGR
ncbi:MAG: hypothetical protein H6Q89_1997 [Myxococcaceae bacterium]|nr:hypothetical protein [Myxococcaceae bacterium]